MISVRCGQCGKELKVKDELAGKKVKCPGCQKPVAVPQLPASPSPLAANAEPCPPKAPFGTENPTVPPNDRNRIDNESLSDADAHTDCGGAWPPLARAALPGNAPSLELVKLLKAAEKPDEIGRLGPYRVLQVLGAGGMGMVFKAEDTGLQRLVALKAMLPSMAGTPTAKERFFREARAVAALKHPHIVTIHQVGEEGGAPFLAMELLEGQTLEERLSRDKPGLSSAGALPLPEILHIGREIAEGLAAAHAKGLIHRDIKPANIWLETTHHSPVTNTKILDFGLARDLANRSHLTHLGDIIGTPAYMAPEQAGGKFVDHRCDLFSLGCVLYRMATGTMAFKGDDTVAILSAVSLDTPPAPATLNPDVPQELSHLIMRLLEKKAEDRPFSAQEVAKELRELEGNAGSTQKLSKPSKTAEVLKARNALTATTARVGAGMKKWLLPAIGGGLAAAIVVGILLLQSGDKPLPKTFTNSTGMDFVLVPKGKAWLGGFNGKSGDKEVEVMHDFYLGKYEVTQEEWEKIMFTNPSGFSRTGAGKDLVKDVSDEDLKRFPVEQVTWEAAQDFAKRLTAKMKESGWVYRLPKETEWEYACRGGPGDKYESSFDYYFEKPTNKLLPEQVNIGAKRTCKVGSYQPNRLGLHDMHGNVLEWCEELLDPKDPKKAAWRVVRGGGWHGVGAHCRAAARTYGAQFQGYGYNGFRLARVPAGKEIAKVSEPVEKKPPVEVKMLPKFKNSTGMEFVLVPKGKSWLGGFYGKPGDKEVEILQDFYLGRFEVTQEEWEKVTGLNPSVFSRTGRGKDLVEEVSDDDLKRFPVEAVSWDAAQDFVKRLNEQSKESGWVYRLPKEAEWEYACRGGPVDKIEGSFDYYFDKPTKKLLPEQANFHSKRTCKVGSYQPNRLGLYDMHGNVWEWCEELYDPKDEKKALFRVERGGGWDLTDVHCRAAYRGALRSSTAYGYNGLRVARVPAGKEVTR